MTLTHRRLDGAWETCDLDETCELVFHIPGMTPEQLTAMPLELLLPLLEVADPPSLETGRRVWRGYAGKLHRAYDLPAVVGDDGSMRWYRWGVLHRNGGLPCIIHADGAREYGRYGRHTP